MKSKSLTRRRFIRSTAEATLGLMAVPTIISSCVKGANDKVNIGMIGTGEHGILRNLKNYLNINDCQVVAMCDVDARRLAKAASIANNHYDNNDMHLFDDFRELLERKDIDAIQISTPDHWHVYQTIASLQAGKHVCCEKPTLTIEQGQILRNELKKYNLRYQTSMEDRFLKPYHRMAEMVRAGQIGKLKRMRVGLPGTCSLRTNSDLTVQTVPDYFNYDMWLGPAPEVPYSPGRTHWSFRWFTDYSGGNLTDWGAHLIDTAQLCNYTEKSGPVEVEGKGTLPENGIFTVFDKYQLKYRYKNGVVLDVHSNQVEIYCEGSDGFLHIPGWNGKIKASSTELQAMANEQSKIMTSDIDEHVNFVKCVREGSAPLHPAEDMHRTASVAHIGNIAMKLERKLQWDPEDESFIDDEEANKLRSRLERDPWSLNKLING